jgi:hypothetical protein
MPQAFSVPISKAFEGRSVTSEVVTLRQAGLPGDLSARLPGSANVSCIDLRHKTLQVSFDSGPGVVNLEGCDLDPEESGDWYVIGSLTEDGVLSDEGVRKFVRVNASTAAGGVSVGLVVSG